ncbi:MAG: glycosyltransferase [Segetibacter sp.]|nr:glycosyltransferase [Segetibacter sp.]
MKLGIISDCIHYKTPDGRIGTENHILLRQLETLCSRFSATLICCPFAKYDSSKVISYYTHPAISFEPMPLVGGDNVSSKLKLLSVIPTWFKGYRKIDKFSNVVYQRFPNNINIPGFFYFFLKRKNVFGTYTGTWKKYEGESFSYALQRWFLAKHFKGPVWVYTDKKTINPRVRPGFSPSYSKTEWDEEIQQVATRIERIKTLGLPTLRLITVGTLIDYKNQLGILEACVLLKRQQFPFLLKIVGDGPMRGELEAFIKENNLSDEVELTGKKNYSQLRELYRQSDFVVQAPKFEGFGKVPIEGFFHGVIPVLNNISMARFMAGDEERGFLFDASSPENIANTLIEIKNKIALLPQMIEKGREFAKGQTLDAWADEYYGIVSNYYKTT